MLKSTPAAIIYVIIGALAAIKKSWPSLFSSHKLGDKDTSIEIAIGDMFSFKGSFIIGSNTTFDTRISTHLISSYSVQGIFTARYYSNEEALDAELDAGLRNIDAETLTEERKGKKKKYPIGTCVRLNPKNCTAYFLAFADINKVGVASSTFEDLKVALSMLWEYIGTHGKKDALVIPVLGSGHGRLTQSRKEIIKEIIKSFVAACSEKTFCDKLTIVLTWSDVLKHKIDWDEIKEYVRYVCKYTEFAPSHVRQTGTPLNSNTQSTYNPIVTNNIKTEYSNTRKQSKLCPKTYSLKGIKRLFTGLDGDILGDHESITKEIERIANQKAFFVDDKNAGKILEKIRRNFECMTEPDFVDEEDPEYTRQAYRTGKALMRILDHAIFLSGSKEIIEESEKFKELFKTRKKELNWFFF